jgi:hypothetical protein
VLKRGVKKSVYNFLINPNIYIVKPRKAGMINLDHKIVYVNTLKTMKCLKRAKFNNFGEKRNLL